MIYLKSCLITLAKLNLSNKELPATEYFITDTMPSLADFHVPGISVPGTLTLYCESSTPRKPISYCIIKRVL